VHAGLKMRLFPDGEALAQAAAQAVAESAAAAIEARGSFHLAMVGGNASRACCGYLRDMPIDWKSLYLYLGDERCLPVGDQERNDTMIEALLLAHVPIPEAQVHRIPAELGPEAGAAAYAAFLEKTPPMDLVLLSMGEDGHMASLFPGHPALRDERLAVPVFDAPKPPPQRISMGFSVLNGARRRIILASGGGKRDALAHVRAGEQLPVAQLSDSEWFVDAAAAGEES
jgi:6-phosphogluconolactonase